MKIEESTATGEAMILPGSRFCEINAKVTPGLITDVTPSRLPKYILPSARMGDEE